MVQKEYAQVSDNAKINYFLKEPKNITILFFSQVQMLNGVICMYLGNTRAQKTRVCLW